jgi:hypothetical protein
LLLIQKKSVPFGRNDFNISVKRGVKRLNQSFKTIVNTQHQKLTACGEPNDSRGYPGNDVDGLCRFFSPEVTPSE